MRHYAFPEALTRQQLVDWYRAARVRTRQLFDLIHPDAYYDRPITLRNPIVFYEGHLPGFSVNTLVKLALGNRGVDEQLETLFARGIDPEDEASAKTPTDLWPSRDAVQSFASDCDALIEETLLHDTLEDESVPHLRGGEAVLTVLEHELMHQETLLYMVHALDYSKKVRASFARTKRTVPVAANVKRETISIPAGIAQLGATNHFGWDNEHPANVQHVPAFAIDAHNVTNGDYLEYIEATGASAPYFWIRGEGEWCWRGMFEPLPLNLDAPVYVTHEEATAYARWKGKRLPTEAEWHRAAEGATEGNFDFATFDPVTIGSYAPSQWGVYDLVGNGWEWTSSLFEPFEGFAPMPSYPVYSADFFDAAHYVLKGASPVTARELVRPSFRNWFRASYPYVFAKFRLVVG